MDARSARIQFIAVDLKTHQPGSIWTSGGTFFSEPSCILSWEKEGPSSIRSDGGLCLEVGGLALTAGMRELRKG